ncbi:SURF1 family protein [Ornithinimicrobium avium]|uniref:SURF1-like protein n=1 Tax=Ornithinimicrobium avium TaxID=2283195 RepID=A0A345NS43_9MICO|nr:SURF1 family protein [Ornithinimicrobium avium]
MAYLVLGVLFGVLTFNLGQWQWHRYQDKAERRDLITANYDAAPVPLGEVLPDASAPLPHDDQWRRVTATGTYLDHDQHLARNRPHGGVFGYEVLVPLLLADGSAVTVDRGWVPNAKTASTLPEVPAPPPGEVTVTGWLRPSEPDLGHDLPAGQLSSIHLPSLAAATGLDLVQAYVVLESEDPPAGRPEALERPDVRVGSHLAYSLQWWLTVPLGVVLVLVMAHQTARDESGAPVRARKPKKVRIWDEEDE